MQHGGWSGGGSFLIPASFFCLTLKCLAPYREREEKIGKDGGDGNKCTMKQWKMLQWKMKVKRISVKINKKSVRHLYLWVDTIMWPHQQNSVNSQKHTDTQFYQ